MPTYNVHPRDGRFLMIHEIQKPEQDPSAAQINIVLNWFDELKRYAPARNR